MKQTETKQNRHEGEWIGWGARMTMKPTQKTSSKTDSHVSYGLTRPSRIKQIVTRLNGLSLHCIGRLGRLKNAFARSPSLSIYLSVCLAICLCLSACLCLSVWLLARLSDSFLYLPDSIFWLICVPACLPACLPACICVPVSGCLYIYTYVHLYKISWSGSWILEVYWREIIF